MAKAIAAAPTLSIRLEAVARLNEAAFSELYRKTSRPLWSYVYRVTSNAADADDIVQEAFCRLLRTAGEDPGSRRPSGLGDQEQWRRYLYRIASNLVVDRWRSTARQRQRDSDMAAGRVQASGEDEDVARTFAMLTPRERALLWLAYVEGENHEDIAASLGLGRRSIKVLLFRARRRLRELLISRGLARA